MGRLYDLDVDKTDKGHLKACGKMQDGNDTIAGCVTFSALDHKPLPLQSSGHPKVQNEIIRELKDRIRVR